MRQTSRKRSAVKKSAFWKEAVCTRDVMISKPRSIIIPQYVHGMIFIKIYLKKKTNKDMKKKKKKK